MCCYSTTKNASEFSFYSWCLCLKGRTFKFIKWNVSLESITVDVLILMITRLASHMRLIFNCLLCFMWEGTTRYGIWFTVRTTWHAVRVTPWGFPSTLLCDTEKRHSFILYFARINREPKRVSGPLNFIQLYCFNMWFSYYNSTPQVIVSNLRSRTNEAITRIGFNFTKDLPSLFEKNLNDSVVFPNGNLFVRT